MQISKIVIDQYINMLARSWVPTLAWNHHQIQHFWSLGQCGCCASPLKPSFTLLAAFCREQGRLVVDRDSVAMLTLTCIKGHAQSRTIGGVVQPISIVTQGHGPLMGKGILRG